MKHAGCPLCSRAGFMKVGGAGGGEGVVFLGWRSAVSLLQVDTLILQQKAAGCGNREILCQQRPVASRSKCPRGSTFILAVRPEMQMGRHRMYWAG